MRKLFTLALVFGVAGVISVGCGSKSTTSSTTSGTTSGSGGSGGGAGGGAGVTTGTVGTGGSTTTTAAGTGGAGGGGVGGSGGGAMGTPCNPVTNEPCNTAAGEACDFGSSGFECYPDGNTAKLCEDCGNGVFCVGTLTCGIDSKCSKFCCDDADCGTGTCDKDATGDPMIGICVDAMMNSACDAPLVSPSNGSCFTP